MEKISTWVDIEAPCEEVFSTVTDVERRMQLSPLWGLSVLREVSPNFPNAGSSYEVHVLTDAPFGIAGSSAQTARSAFAGLATIMAVKMGGITPSDAAELAQHHQADSPADEPAEAGSVVDPEQRYFVSAYEPPYKFSYYMDANCQTRVTWRLQPIARGTRVHYEEVICPESVSGEDFLPTVHRVVQEWLANIKRYSELRGDGRRRFLRNVLDRFYLKLRPDQRRTVLLILFVQGLALGTFLTAAIGLAIAGLLF
ncbi:MAG: hypothetical protein ACM3QS_05925 [Bacteroidota bacterium]